jgi:hypothetical protein
MPRKDRNKKKKESVEVTITNETGSLEVETLEETVEIKGVETQPEVAEEKDINTKEETPVYEFQSLILKVQTALSSDKGKRLNCRVRVLVQDREAVVYQGLRSNIWGRLKANGNHSIYRHALARVLREDPATANLFK